MPLYEYKCEGCGEVFELMQKFSDEPIQVHEKCGAPVHRLLSAPALQFKGSGWYVTDYGRRGGSNAPKGDSAAKSSSDTAAKAETKPGDSKPASNDKSKSG